MTRGTSARTSSKVSTQRREGELLDTWFQVSMAQDLMQSQECLFLMFQIVIELFNAVRNVFACGNRTTVHTKRTGTATPKRMPGRALPS